MTDNSGNVISEFTQQVTGRGMQYQAREFEELVTNGQLGSELMPPMQSVHIMELMDTIRHEIGLIYPEERKITVSALQDPPS